MSVSPAEVLAFWFGDPPAAEARAAWFRKDEAFDTVIRERFGALIEAALARALEGPAWSGSPPHVLARIVVLDQFTRNAFRGTARAFSGDASALAWARALVQSGGDRDLPPLQRWFAYLPFEHAEDAAAQAESLRLFEALALEHPALDEARVWAVRHAEVIARFGRYPHRNAILGRDSTAEELAFLAQPGSSF